MPGFRDFLKEYNIENNILPIDIEDNDWIMMIIKPDFKIDYKIEKMN
jgi:hypothetical protein